MLSMPSRGCSSSDLLLLTLYLSVFFPGRPSPVSQMDFIFIAYSPFFYQPGFELYISS